MNSYNFEEIIELQLKNIVCCSFEKQMWRTLGIKMGDKMTCNVIQKINIWSENMWQKVSFIIDFPENVLYF